jgi:hypothetical protein
VPLRAVYNDGKKQSVGSVRGMWSSGVVVETDVRAGIGSPFALVILSGGFDGARIAAEVAGVDKSGLMLHLPGLDGARFSRLRALVEGKPVTGPMPASPAGRQPPPNVPAFIISGGDDDDALADPTGLVVLGPDDRKDVKAAKSAAASAKAPAAAAKKPSAPAPLSFPPPPLPLEGDPTNAGFDIPGHTDPFARARVTTTEADLEEQVLELGRANAELSADNAKLRAEVARLTALKSAVEEELGEAQGKLDDIEKTLKRR